MEFTSSVVPETRKGRKPIELDEAAVEYLCNALLEAPSEEDDGNERPIAYGPTTVFTTESKAQGEGRRYAKRLMENELQGVPIRTRVESAVFEGTGDEGFSWRIYVPVSELDKLDEYREG